MAIVPNRSSIWGVPPIVKWTNGPAKYFSMIKEKMEKCLLKTDGQKRSWQIYLPHWRCRENDVSPLILMQPTPFVVSGVRPSQLLKELTSIPVFYPIFFL